MGSFSFTCSFSKLPIPAGTPVRLFLLTKNPYEHRSVGCEQTTFWVPRSFPIKGEYDECGSIDRVETSLASRAMTGLLAIDGDDVPFSKDAKTGRRTVELEGLLSSIACGKGSVLRNRDRGHVRYLPELPEETEARVKKSAETEKLWRETVKPKKLAKGLPTKARVKRALAAAGLKVDGNGVDGFSVRNMKFGQVRVKYVPWGLNQEALDKAVTALTKKGYAAMAVAGSYESEGVVLVRPKPGNPDYREIKHKEPKTVVPLSFSMVREDVWQALTGVTLPPYCGDRGPKTLAGRRESVQAWWDFNMKVPEKDRYFARNEVPQEIMSDVWGIHEDKVPYQMGIASTFEYAVERFKDGSATQEEVNAFLDTVAEFLFVSDVLFLACRDWTPPTSCGTQEAVWGHSVLFLDAVSGVAQGHYKRELAEREEEERKEREREAKAAAKKARKEKAELWDTSLLPVQFQISPFLGKCPFASTSFARCLRRIGFISNPTLSGFPECFRFERSTTTTGRSWMFKKDPSEMSGRKGCSSTWQNGSKGKTPTTTFRSRRT